MPRNFGHIEGVTVGSLFADRRALRDAGIHLPLQAGVAGDQHEGAESIVMSGGYIDDEDHGDLIIYTGAGGNDPNTRQQIADQQLVRGNLWLTISCNEGRPIRVVRGASHRSPHSPPSGYRYDGLYSVEKCDEERGRDGFYIWRFRLQTFNEVPMGSMGSEIAALPIAEEGQDQPAPRGDVTSQRIIRNTMVGTRVKQLHDYTCQICGTHIQTKTGPYAEAAHIRPLGRPHDGPDVTSNILCLCPNCHVKFDRHALYVEADNSVCSTATRNPIGQLRVISSHAINFTHLDYQKRRCIGHEDQ